MDRRTSAVITTACVGVAACTAAYMATGSKHKGMKGHAKKLKKNTNKALRQMGDFIDNVSYMMH